MLKLKLCPIGFLDLFRSHIVAIPKAKRKVHSLGLRNIGERNTTQIKSKYWNIQEFNNVTEQIASFQEPLKNSKHGLIGNLFSENSKRNVNLILLQCSKVSIQNPHNGIGVCIAFDNDVSLLINIYP